MLGSAERRAEGLHQRLEALLAHEEVALDGEVPQVLRRRVEVQRGEADHRVGGFKRFSVPKVECPEARQITVAGEPVGEIPPESRGVDSCGRDAPRVTLVDVSGTHCYATKGQDYASAKLVERGATRDDPTDVHQGAHVYAIERPTHVLETPSSLGVRAGTVAVCVVKLVDSDYSRLPTCKKRPTKAR